MDTRPVLTLTTLFSKEFPMSYILMAREISSKDYLSSANSNTYSDVMGFYSRNTQSEFSSQYHGNASKEESFCYLRIVSDQIEGATESVGQKALRRDSHEKPLKALQFS